MSETASSGAYPGFPIGGSPTVREGGGVLTYEIAKFYEKLHEIEKILGRRGGSALPAPPKSANDHRFTGQARLIRSHSSARFCIELSGNSNKQCILNMK